MFLFIATWSIVFINACLGIFIYFEPQIYEEFGIFFFLISLTSTLLIVIYFKDIFLYQLRILFLVVIGLVAGFVKLINPDLAFSPVGVEVQNMRISAMMFGLTSLALLGSSIGLAWTRSSCQKTYPSVIFNNWEPKLLFYLGTPFILLIGYLSAISYGPSVFESVYMSSQEGKGQLLGNLQSIGVIILGINFLSAYRINKNKYLFLAIFLGGYLLVWGIMIRGARLEFLSGLLTIFIAGHVVRGKSCAVNSRFYIFLLLLAIGAEFYGYLRSTMSIETSESFIEGYQRIYDSGILFFGTISGIATSFANILDMVDVGQIELQFGGSYWDYILRVPPYFLYPDRPLDLALIFENYGYESIGGVFEIAEAYFNFGLIGSFFIPFFISLIFGGIYTRALKGGKFYFFLLLGLLSVFPRGAWYQTFAYFKALLTAAILFLIYWLIMEYLFATRVKWRTLVRRGPLK